MKNLVLVTDAWHPQVNGVVTTLEKMIQLSSDRGWTVTVIHPGLFKTIPTPTYPEIRTVVDPWKLGGLLQSSVDSLHIATEGSLGIAARILAWRRNWFFTSGFHTNFPEYLEHRTKIPARLFYPCLRWMHQRSKAVMVPSSSTKQKLQAAGFKNILLWGRGFDENIFYPGTVGCHSPLRLLYVGRVSVEKNLPALLDLSSSENYQIMVVGDGPARAALQRQYPRVHFTGYKWGQELGDVYRDADVFVFPSLTDTFGIVMVEAMACGLPVVAFNVEGPRDVVENGVGGILCDDLERGVLHASRLKNSMGVRWNAARHSWTASADIFFKNLVTVAGARYNT